MSMTTHTCKEDGDMPKDINIDDVFMIEVHTCIGWIDVTVNFTETQVGMLYRFYFN